MIEVPFIVNPDAESCALVATQGVLASLGARDIPTIDTLATLCGTENDVTYSVDLACTLRTLGVHVEFCSAPSEKHSLAVPQLGEEVKERYVQTLEEGRLQQIALNAEDYRGLLDAGKPIISLIDTRHIWEIEGAKQLGDSVRGHFVTVVGYEGDNFLIHQSGPYKAKIALPISTSKFFDAHSQPGTFSDSIIVHGLR